MATFHIDIGNGDVREIRLILKVRLWSLAKTKGKDFQK